MFSKSMRVCTLFIVILSNLSCTEFLKGRSQTESVIKIEGTILDCFDSAAENLQKFDRTKTKPEEVQDSLACFQKGLVYFKSKTKASLQDPDNYTSDQMRKFFGKFLGDNSRVTVEMATEMMRLKSGLFAGSDSSMSKNELQSLIDLLQIMINEIETLKPYWKILLLADTSSEVGLEHIKIAQQIFVASLERVLAKTELHRTEYSFSHFKSLVFEIEKFIKIGNNESQSLGIDKWFPLVESIKALLLGDHLDMNSRMKWKEAIFMASELHRFYMIYSFHLDKHPIISKPGIAAGNDVLLLLINLIDSSWVMKAGGISFQLTENLFNALEERKLLPQGISSKGVSQTYQNLVIKVLERESKNPRISVKSLQKRHMNFLKTEYEVWRNTQAFTDTFPDFFDFSFFSQRLKEYQFVASPNQFPETDFTAVQHSWEDWKSHLSQPIPMLYLPSGELILSNQVKKMKNWSWYSLSKLNLQRTLSRSLMLGYGTKRTSVLKRESLSEDSLVEWFDDYKVLGVEIKAFDPRGGNTGKRSFFEANQFVMSGNGDQKVDQQEAFEFVNIIFSSGLSGLKEIQKKMTEAGCETREKDAFNNPWLDESCFKSNLKAHFSEFFKNLPGLKHYVRELSDEKWNDLYDQLLVFARTSSENVGKIETSDLRTLVVILHYVESMYIRFDQDLDDRLSKEELIKGSKRFVPFFKEQFGLEASVGGLQDRFYKFMVSQGFACMVLTGKMPTFTGCLKVFLQDAWEDRYSDRLRILKTLNQFKAQVQ